MGDGENATPGHHRASNPDDANQWITRKPQPSPGAAPWERARVSDSDNSDGVSVAELIARVSGSEPVDHGARHRAEQGPGPTAEEQAWINADTVPTPSAYAAELPDLESLLRRPSASVVVQPIRVAPPGRVSPPAAAAAPAREHRRRRPVLVLGRSAAALIAVLALALTGGAWQWSTSKNNSLNTVAALDPQSRDIVDPSAQFGDENFLIVGVDSRAGANSDVGAGDQTDAGGARSDTVMLVNIPANRKRVVAVSFPRDLAITPMKCESWNSDTGTYGPSYDSETGSYGSDQVYTETKLNSAYAFGGPKCLVKVIQKLSGLNINRFMAIDFNGFSKMVDALGGVEVCSTTPLQDYELGTVLADAGPHMLDGHTALNYVRARQVTTEVNGDYGRIKRQQLFLSSLLRSMISKDVFFNLSKLNNVVNMFIEDTSVDNVQTKDLVDLGQSIQGVSAGRVTFLTAPTTGETDADGNEPPRTQDIRAIFDAIIDDEPLPGEKSTNKAEPSTSTTQAPPPPAATATDSGTGELVDAVTTAPEDVTVQVSNSTGETGLATTAAGELQQHGFHVEMPNDNPSSLRSTTVYFSAGNEQAAATVASAFTNPTIERVSGMGEVVHVVLGSDFNRVKAPSPSGSAVRVQVTFGSTTSPTALPEDLSVTNAADTTCE